MIVILCQGPESKRDQPYILSQFIWSHVDSNQKINVPHRETKKIRFFIFANQVNKIIKEDKALRGQTGNCLGASFGV